MIYLLLLVTIKNQASISNTLHYLHIKHWSSCLNQMQQIITLCAPRGSNLVICVILIIYVFVIFLCSKPIKAASLYGGFFNQSYQNPCPNANIYPNPYTNHNPNTNLIPKTNPNSNTNPNSRGQMTGVT